MCSAEVLIQAEEGRRVLCQGRFSRGGDAELSLEGYIGMSWLRSVKRRKAFPAKLTGLGPLGIVSYSVCLHTRAGVARRVKC